MVDYKDIKSLKQFWDKFKEELMISSSEYPERILRNIFYMACGGIYTMMRDNILEQNMTTREKIEFLQNIENEIREFCDGFLKDESKPVKH